MPINFHFSHLKKVAIFTLLSIFLFNSAGYYILFEVSRQMAKKEMHTMIDANQGKTITMVVNDPDHNPGFHRLNGKEIIINGIMYDVVQENDLGSATLFVCHLDSKESKLISGLKKESQNKMILSLRENYVMTSVIHSCFNFNNSFLQEMLFPDGNISLESFDLPSWTPPPERV
ncbi:MAG: hypothetical protein WCL00_04575 [Bacteroidota bacterium]